MMMEIYAASKKLAPTKLEIPEKTNTTNKPQPFEEVQGRPSTSRQATTARLP
jgi:hypothetical protein